MHSRWIALLLFAMIPALFGTRCASYGLVYRKHTEPVLQGQAVHRKFSRACARSYLYLVTTGDATLRAARSEGGITRVMSVDREYTEILMGFLYRRYCIIISGE